MFDDQIEAVFENGVFRPLGPVDLPEHQRVTVRTTTLKFAESPGPQTPFLTEEICVPCSIPWPVGAPTHAVRVVAPLPTAHDVPRED